MSEWKTHNKSQFNDSWDFENNKTLIGHYIEHKENVGKNHQHLYIVLCEGQKYDIWGCKTLNDGMSDVNVGDDVMIIYKGINNNPKYANPMKMFEVKSKEHDSGKNNTDSAGNPVTDLPF